MRRRLLPPRSWVWPMSKRGEVLITREGRQPIRVGLLGADGVELRIGAGESTQWVTLSGDEATALRAAISSLLDVEDDCDE